MVSGFLTPLYFYYQIGSFFVLFLEEAGRLDEGKSFVEWKDFQCILFLFVSYLALRRNWLGLAGWPLGMAG